jgi:hypothetical protein
MIVFRLLSSGRSTTQSSSSSHEPSTMFLLMVTTSTRTIVFRIGSTTRSLLAVTAFTFLIQVTKASTKTYGHNSCSDVDHGYGSHCQTKSSIGIIIAVIVIICSTTTTIIIIDSNDRGTGRSIGRIRGECIAKPRCGEFRGRRRRHL